MFINILQVSDIDFYFLQDCDSLRFINHIRKIVDLRYPNEKRFQAALSLSGMKDLCLIGYTTVNYVMLNVFVER